MLKSSLLLKLIFFITFFFWTTKNGSAQELRALDHYLNEVYHNHVIPGFSVVVVNSEGYLYAKGFGKERLNLATPFTKTSVNAIGSLTKSLTALGIMQLVEQGDLELDVPVVQYLPWFRTANKSMSDKITVRMLLNNTSGLKASPEPIYDVSDRALEKLVQDLQSTFITKEPGMAYEYSNLGFSIAGYLLSEVSGLPYAEYLDKRIFSPLGMKNTSTDPARFDAMGALEGHYHGIEHAYPASRERQFESGEYIPAGSFTRSTAEDIGKYLIALLNEGRYGNIQVLSSESINEIWSPNISFPGLTLEEGGDDQPIHYGLGWMLSEIESRKIVHHGGSTGKMSSMTMIDLTNQIAVTVLANLDLTFIDQYQYPTIYHIANNILHITTGGSATSFGRPTIADPSQNDFELEPAEVEKYLGDFVQIAGGDFWVNFGLSLHIKRQSGQGLEAIVTRGKDTITHFELDFASPSAAIGRNMAIPQRLQFKLTPNGKVKGLFCSGTEYSRINEQRRQHFKSVNIKDSINLSIPNTWELQETPYGFVVNDPENASTRIQGYVKDTSKSGDIDTRSNVISDAESNQSQWFSLRKGEFVWKHQSILNSKKGEIGIHTTFISEMSHVPVRFEIASKSEIHTLILQEVMIPLLNSLRILR
ncbi:serine hydrolase [Ulvibacterium sp.]|uniref:serine hydrolase domain-containing protein n=1 Tax=Ulvibacterium sp. TaxID=2665914 RepID=UPI002627FFF7|nr:serine hydrolase [Ulvibacterium sp.]